MKPELNIETIPLPPWKAHPLIPRGSIGWRMGSGEVYLLNWLQWYSELDPSEKKAYRKLYREPIRWWGFYDNSLFKTIIVWLGHWLLYPLVIMDYKAKKKKLEEQNKEELGV